MTNALRIGIAGLGTVGAGVVSLLATHGDLIAARAGRPVAITSVSARDRNKDRGVDLSGFAWASSPLELASHPDVDVVMELIGGSEGLAKELVERALAGGKHVITANKALIAHHGPALARAAEKAKVTLSYEAAVAGGIPIIKALREGMAGNDIKRIYGILNGTCNYILTTMRETGRDFADVLADAQALGYAEADPSFDIDGVDAAHKLAILAMLAYGADIDFESLSIEGIRNISALDIAHAEELGYRIKLLGLAQPEGVGLSLRVQPVLVPKEKPIAAVEGVFNAVAVEGDFLGSLMMEGRGAGAGPTASAVVADLIDIARGTALPTFAVSADQLVKRPISDPGAHVGAFFLRLMVIDRPGVIADVAAALRDAEISVEALLQRGRDPGEPVAVVITTHETTEGQMIAALGRIAELGAVLEKPTMIRIDNLT